MNTSSFGGTCSLTLLHDALAFRGKFLDPFAERLRPHLRPREEGGEELPHRRFSEDQPNADQDPGPCR